MSVTNFGQHPLVEVDDSHRAANKLLFRVLMSFFLISLTIESLENPHYTKEVHYSHSGLII